MWWNQAVSGEGGSTSDFLALKNQISSLQQRRRGRYPPLATPDLASPIGEADEAEVRVPLALDCMCGPNAPWSRALEWCGWSTRPRDWLIDPAHDLTSPAMQSEVRASLASADALLWAMDCNTLTRARDRPIPGESHPPMRLRSQRCLGVLLRGFASGSCLGVLPRGFASGSPVRAPLATG